MAGTSPAGSRVAGLRCCVGKVNDVLLDRCAPPDVLKFSVSGTPACHAAVEQVAIIGHRNGTVKARAAVFLPGDAHAAPLSFQFRPGGGAPAPENRIRTAVQSMVRQTRAGPPARRPTIPRLPTLTPASVEAGTRPRLAPTLPRHHTLTPPPALLVEAGARPRPAHVQRSGGGADRRRGCQPEHRMVLAALHTWHPGRRPHARASPRPPHRLQGSGNLTPAHPHTLPLSAQDRPWGGDPDARPRGEPTADPDPGPHL